MGTDDKKVNQLKMVFSLISVFLMIPQISGGGSGYYKTLFIFLINRVIDMILKSQSLNCEFLAVWEIINQWFGVLVCAFSFSMLMTDFSNIFIAYDSVLNIVMFVVVVSCVLREFIVLIVASVKEKKVRKRLESNN